MVEPGQLWCLQEYGRDGEIRDAECVVAAVETAFVLVEFLAGENVWGGPARTWVPRGLFVDRGYYSAVRLR